jgi:diaminopimelate epimerase
VDAPLDKFDLAAPPTFDDGQFPAGANLELVQVTGPATLAMRVYERGCGQTRSCGTGAVAAAAAASAARAAGGTGPAAGTRGTVGESWQVRVLGGDLTVTLEAATSWLTGPAVIVAEGELNSSWLTAEPS